VIHVFAYKACCFLLVLGSRASKAYRCNFR